MAEEELWSGWNQVEKQLKKKTEQEAWKKLKRRVGDPTRFHKQ